MSDFLRQQLVQMDTNNLLVPTAVLLGTCEPIIFANHSNAQTEANLKCCTQDEASKAESSVVTQRKLESNVLPQKR
jgi:hypothetical protein